MKDAKTEAQDSVGSLGYVGASVRGDHYLIDVDKVAVPTPDTASVADPLELLLERDSALYAGSSIIKPKADWPSRSALKSKRIYLEVKTRQYPRLIRKLLSANMITLRQSREETIENSIFGVWKEPGVSQR